MPALSPTTHYSSTSHIVIQGSSSHHPAIVPMMGAPSSSAWSLREPQVGVGTGCWVHSGQLFEKSSCHPLLRVGDGAGGDALSFKGRDSLTMNDVSPEKKGMKEKLRQ